MDRLCKDCKHFGGSGFFGRMVSPLAQQFAKCHHKQSLTERPGSVVISGFGDSGYYCSTMRGSRCGVEGKLFE